MYYPLSIKINAQDYDLVCLEEQIMVYLFVYIIQMILMI